MAPFLQGHRLARLYIIVNLLPSLKLTAKATENGWLEYYFPYGINYFQVLHYFSGRVVHDKHHTTSPSCIDISQEKILCWMKSLSPQRDYDIIKLYQSCCTRVMILPTQTMDYSMEIPQNYHIFPLFDRLIPSNLKIPVVSCEKIGIFPLPSVFFRLSKCHI